MIHRFENDAAARAISRRDVVTTTMMGAVTSALPSVGLAKEAASRFKLIAQAPDLAWNGAVFSGGRLFASIPAWIGPTPGVVEVAVDGSHRPFPGDRWNSWDGQNEPLKRFVDINSIFADDRGNLWVVDAAAPGFGKGIPGAAKIVQIDLASNQVVRTIGFDGSVMGENQRFGHLRIHGDHAILTESKTGAFVIVDLRDGSSRKILSGHPLMRCRPEDVPIIEGRRLERDGKPVYIHNDLLEIAPDGETLYFCCLFGRRMFAVPVSVLKDPSLDDAAIAARVTVAFTFDRPWIAGMCRDPTGNLFMTDAENSAVRLRTPNGGTRMLARDPELIWPIAPSVDGKGRLYVTATQLNRLPLFAGGEDRVKRPWLMFSLPVPTGGNPADAPPPHNSDELSAR